MRTSVFKQSSDDWYGNYEIADDGRHVGKKYVEVSLLPLRPEGHRVCVWGNDDCGMERDFLEEDKLSAQELFSKICLEPILSKELLETYKFVRA